MFTFKGVLSNPAGRVFTREFTALWLAALIAYFGFQSLTASLPLYAARLGADELALGALTGLIALVALFTRPVVGWWIDRRSAGGPLILGCLIFGFCAFGYRLAASVGMLLALRAVTGLAVALFGTSSQTLAANLAPPQRRGEAMSLFAVALTLGQGFGPAAGIAVVRLVDYPGLFSFCVALSLVGAAIASMLRVRRAAPEVRPARGLINPRVFTAGLLLAGLNVTFGVNFGLLAIHASRRGLDNPGLVFLAYAAGVFAAQTFAGRLSDRFGRIAIVAPGLALAAAGMWATALLGGWWLLLAGALSGTGLGATQPTLYALAADMVPLDERGSAIGTMGMFHEIGIVLGGIGGGVLGRAWGLGAMFGMAGLAPALGAVFALIHRADRVSAASRIRA